MVKDLIKGISLLVDFINVAPVFIENLLVSCIVKELDNIAIP